MHLLGQIPSDYFLVACSGGMDSMVLVDLLLRFPRNRFDLAFFDHGTPDCKTALEFLKDLCPRLKLELFTGHVRREQDHGESLEAYWRDQRYEFLNGFDCPVLTAHHLNDVIETYVMSCLKGGQPKLIPYRRQNVIRPLLTVSRDEITAWAVKHEVSYVEDLSNQDTKHLRNYVRHEMMPYVLHVNKGIGTMLKKKVLAEFSLNPEQ